MIRLRVLPLSHEAMDTSAVQAREVQEGRTALPNGRPIPVGRDAGLPSGNSHESARMERQPSRPYFNAASSAPYVDHAAAEDDQRAAVKGVSEEMVIAANILLTLKKACRENSSGRKKSCVSGTREPTVALSVVVCFRCLKACLIREQQQHYFPDHASQMPFSSLYKNKY